MDVSKSPFNYDFILPIVQRVDGIPRWRYCARAKQLFIKSKMLHLCGFVRNIVYVLSAIMIVITFYSSLCLGQETAKLSSCRVPTCLPHTVQVGKL